MPKMYTTGNQIRMFDKTRSRPESKRKMLVKPARVRIGAKSVCSKPVVIKTGIVAKAKKNNVLFLCQNDWANVGNRLSVAINRHFGNEWNSRCIAGNVIQNYHYSYDILAKANSNIIRNLMLNADVIIYGSSYFGWKPFKNPINPNAVIGIWHGGTTYRNKYDYFNAKVHPNCDIIFAHRDLEGLGQNVIRLNAPFDVDAVVPNFSKPHGVIYLGHSPSKRHVKGTEHFEEAIKKFQRSGRHVKPVLMEGLTNAQVIEKKKSCHFFFDQIGAYNIPQGATKGYGVSLIEAASAGCVCLAWCKYPDTPIITVNNADDIINAVLQNCGNYESIARTTRDWVAKEHGYRAVATHFIEEISKKI